jgi:hypothetical protein
MYIHHLLKDLGQKFFNYLIKVIEFLNNSIISFNSRKFHAK